MPRPSQILLLLLIPIAAPTFTAAKPNSTSAPATAPSAGGGKSEADAMLRTLSTKQSSDVWLAIAKQGKTLNAEGKTALINGLLDYIRGQDTTVRDQAMLVLSSLEEAAAEAIPALLKILKADPQSRVAGILGSLGPKADEAIPQLVQAMQAGNTAAVYSFCVMEKRAAPAVPAMIDLLKKGKAAQGGKSTAIEREVIVALGMIGPPAKDAIPVLKEITQNKSDKELATRAATALKSIEK